MPNPLYDALFATGAADAPAVEAGGRVWTYAELAAEAARWDGALGDLGVEPGDRICVQVEKSVANLFLYLGALRRGAVFNPLNPAYTDAELSFFVADAEPALIVCDPGRRDGVAAFAGSARLETLGGAGQGSLAGLADRARPPGAPAPRAPEDLAALCYTSGTTGRSKGAMLSHRALLSNAATLAALWRFTSSDVLIHALPLFHVHGLFVATHTSLLAGASMRLHMRFDSATVLAAMGESSVLMGVPTYYVRLLAESGLTAARAAGMRLFISGSAPLLAQTYEDWRARTGKPILERYGMTETGMNASNPCDGERRGGTVGPPLPGVEIRIVDAADAPLPQRATGQVQVRGPNLFSGYWRAPEKTRRAFAADGWFRTGDLGAFDSDGYLCLSGRASDLIISGGLNVYPAEVERQIDQVAGVRESAVIGLPHPDLGEAVTAIIAGDALSEAEVLASLVGTLARFKQPKRALFVEALPRNSMGKVVKAELRERYAELYLST